MIMINIIKGVQGPVLTLKEQHALLFFNLLNSFLIPDDFKASRGVRNDPRNPFKSLFLRTLGKVNKIWKPINEADPMLYLWQGIGLFEEMTKLIDLKPWPLSYLCGNIFI